MSEPRDAATAAFAKYLRDEPSRHHFIQINDPKAPVTAKVVVKPSSQNVFWDTEGRVWRRKDPVTPLLLQKDIFSRLLALRQELRTKGQYHGVKKLQKEIQIRYGGVIQADVDKCVALWRQYDLETESPPSPQPREPVLASAASTAPATSGPSTRECMTITPESLRELKQLLDEMRQAVQKAEEDAENEEKDDEEEDDDENPERIPIPILNMEHWIWVMRDARKPKVYTTPDSILGRGNATYEEADVLFLTAAEARLEMLRDPHTHWKPIVVFADLKEGADDIRTFLRELVKDGKATVDVQPQGIINEPETWSLEDVLEHFKDPWTSNDHLPLNLLDLEAGMEFQPLWLRDRRFRLLTDVYRHVIDGNAEPHSAGRRGVHKGRVAADMYVSQRFRLLAQRGAVSLPHHDHHGMSTWATVLEGKKVGTMWTPRDNDELDVFGEKGVEYNRPDKFYVVLEKGQTIIMRRPLTIHSPRTLQDCLLDSGCFWRYDNIIAAMESTIFELSHPDTTNEEPAGQLVPLLRVLEEWIEEKPGKFEAETSLDRFDELHEVFGLSSAMNGRSNRSRRSSGY